MQKGKHPFIEPYESEAPSPMFSEQLDESAYFAKPSNMRRQLTPRDHAHNQRVKQLFRNVKPGLPIDADPPETRHETEPFATIIEKTLQHLKITQSPWLTELSQVWHQIVPPEIAKVTIPGKWDNGILYIYVTTSIQLFEIRRTYLKQIETAVRTFAGDNRVKHVRLMVNSVSLP